MTNNLFNASRSKIARAVENLNGLEMEFKRFNDSKPYSLRQENGLKSGHKVLVYTPTAPIPSNWVVIIGEILYQLRSALDLAVHELTVRETGNTLKNTEFPIFNDKIAFFERKRDGSPTNESGLYKIRGLSQRAQDVIETLQPYNIRQNGVEPTISILHEMNIIDKHRELLLCRILNHKTRVTLIRDVPNFVGLGFDVPAGHLDESTVIARLESNADLDDEMYMDADVVLEIAFDKSCASGFLKAEGVSKTINTIVAAVNTVLSLLEKAIVV